MAKQKKMKLPVPIGEIERRFISQLNFLQRSMTHYDAGEEDEVLRMATALRTLFHRSHVSHPLIDQVGLQHVKLMSRCNTNERNLLSDYGVTMLQISASGVRYLPILDDPLARKVRWLSIAEWQSEEIIILRELGKQVRLSRWDLVLAMANQDGGAHSDPEGVAEDYHALTYENFGGFVTGEGMGKEKDIFGAEKASVRHIAWEAHKSLSDEWEKLLGKRGCICGSGRQKRYCCGKVTT